MQGNTAAEGGIAIAFLSQLLKCLGPEHDSSDPSRSPGDDSSVSAAKPEQRGADRGCLMIIALQTGAVQTTLRAGVRSQAPSLVFIFHCCQAGR